MDLNRYIRHRDVKYTLEILIRVISIRKVLSNKGFMKIY